MGRIAVPHFPRKSWLVPAKQQCLGQGKYICATSDVLIVSQGAPPHLKSWVIIWTATTIQKTWINWKETYSKWTESIQIKKLSYFISRRPQLVIVPLLCPLGSVEPSQLVPHQRSRCHCNLWDMPCHPPKHQQCHLLDLCVQISLTAEAELGLSRHVERAKRSEKSSWWPWTQKQVYIEKEYGIWYLTFCTCTNSGGLYLSYYSYCFFCLLKIEETCFSAFAIDMSPQQEHLGIKQAPTPPTSGFVI